MPKKKRIRIPSVRIIKVKGRPLQLRYHCPETGKEIRISAKTHVPEEAEEAKSDLEAKLRLGIDPKARQKSTEFNSNMPWDTFREFYFQQHLKHLRARSRESGENRLDLFEEIMQPKTIGEAFSTHFLNQAQSAFLEGKASRRNKPRSRQTVRSYMTSITCAANWAYDQGWLEQKPRFKKLKTAKSKTMKGRPITQLEFEKMLDSVEAVVGPSGVEDWKYILRGLYESALRLSELICMTWDKKNSIQPVWASGREPVLRIPASMQKNNTTEDIPLLPWFEKVLLETPESERTGFVFHPRSIQEKYGRKPGTRRPSAEWAGKIISRIGKESGVVVEEANERTGAPTKYVSAHDLRRTCGQRLQDAGVPPLVISRIMRHSSWETTQKHYVPGNVQNDAKVLKNLLKESGE